MTKQEIDAFEPDALPGPGVTAIDHAHRVMERSGYWNANQQMGRRWPVGCVALEITQRCNLDCTLCYLSENSEAVQDVPVDEVFRRVELIYQHYGRNTDVQITGGDPTLRRRDELIAIVRKVRSFGMRPTLMTNGIRATRSLLEELAAAGLVDVSFHVDTTQRIKGYASEIELNAIREAYIGRVRGLGLSVFFSTTVHRGNFHEIPDLVRFFKAHAGTVRTAAFQLAADTGRGEHGARGDGITIESVARQIEAGAGTPINFHASLIGHPACNRHGMCLAVNGKLFDALDDTAFIGCMLSATAQLALPRNDRPRVIKSFLWWLAANPRHFIPIAKWAARKGWVMREDLVAARGRVDTISFIVHNFMHADALERGRIDACVFKVMTADGPLSMCLHNARRDRFILQPVAVRTPDGEQYWQPLTGLMTRNPDAPAVVKLERRGPKRLKGLARQQWLAQRRA
ncbi:MAG: radical SAM protein [Betaproteobacteria bacterium]|nr:radical SAM protein [Betaproteobacteria bacterium]